MNVSAWSDVDASERPARFVSGLDRLRADPFFARQKARLLDGLNLRGGEHAVDVGCGTGEDTAELCRAGCDAFGLERSATMLAEARRRHRDARFVAGDACALPNADSALDRVLVDRVLQHLVRGEDAAREWRRVLRSGGRVAVFEPDLTTARIEGMDAAAAEAVVRWRAGTRPGARAVRELPHLLRGVGFVDARVDSVLLDLADLGRADGIMGLADWGTAAGRAGALAPAAAARWHDDAHDAFRDGTLRYKCAYLIGSARVG